MSGPRRGTAQRRRCEGAEAQEERHASGDSGRMQRRDGGQHSAPLNGSFFQNAGAGRTQRKKRSSKVPSADLQSRDCPDIETMRHAAAGWRFCDDRRNPQPAPHSIVDQMLAASVSNGTDVGPKISLAHQTRHDVWSRSNRSSGHQALPVSEPGREQMYLPTSNSLGAGWQCARGRSGEYASQSAAMAKLDRSMLHDRCAEMGSIVEHAQTGAHAFVFPDCSAFAGLARCWRRWDVCFMLSTVVRQRHRRNRRCAWRLAGATLWDFRTHARIRACRLSAAASRCGLLAALVLPRRDQHAGSIKPTDPLPFPRW